MYLKAVCELMWLGKLTMTCISYAALDSSRLSLAHSGLVPHSSGLMWSPISAVSRALYPPSSAVDSSITYTGGWIGYILGYTLADLILFTIQECTKRETSNMQYFSAGSYTNQKIKSNHLFCPFVQQLTIMLCNLNWFMTTHHHKLSYWGEDFR